MTRRPPRSTLLPYTTLVRSQVKDSTRNLILTGDRKSTRLNSSHDQISYAVFCWKKKKRIYQDLRSGYYSATRTNFKPQAFTLLDLKTVNNALDNMCPASPHLFAKSVAAPHSGL